MQLCKRSAQLSGNRRKQGPADTRFQCGPPVSNVAAENLCNRYDDYDAAQWRTEFLGTTRSGTWHVFVASVGEASRQEADRRAQTFRDNYPHHDFEVMPTASATRGSCWPRTRTK